MSAERKTRARAAKTKAAAKTRKTTRKKPTQPKGPASRRRSVKRKRPGKPVPPRPIGEDERIAERRLAAWSARVAGASLRQIAEELGIALSTAHEDVAAVLDEVNRGLKRSVEGHRSLELERTDRYVRSLLPGIVAGNPKAIRVALQCSIHRARLLGLYQHDEGTADDQAKDFLVFLEEFWRRRRLKQQKGPIIDIVPKKITEGD